MTLGPRLRARHLGFVTKRYPACRWYASQYAECTASASTPAVETLGLRQRHHALPLVFLVGLPFSKPHSEGLEPLSIEDALADLSLFVPAAVARLLPSFAAARGRAAAALIPWQALGAQGASLAPARPRLVGRLSWRPRLADSSCQYLQRLHFV